MASGPEEPKPGDLIEIFHLCYSHWALYVGDGYVIHLAPPSELSKANSSSLVSTLSNKAVVKRELLKDVVGNCHYQINNHLDHEYKPLPVNKIINSAKEKIGEQMEYSILGRNCEHFVTNLRYGKPRSRQAENFVLGTEITLGIGFLGVLSAIGYRALKRQTQKH